MLGCSLFSPHYAIMLKKSSVILAAIWLCSGSAVLGSDEIVITAQEQQAVSVTIYNQNLALIKDRRTINLPQGTQTLAFREVSARIKPETALMHGRNLAVLEQNFEYDLLTPQSLLQKYVGREVTMIRRHPASSEEQPVQAKVLSAGNGVVLQVGNRIETEVTGRLVYPDVPANLRDRPTLTMLVESTEAGTREVELSYLTGGLSWQANYVAELSARDDQLNLSGWVTLTNESGAQYPDARLQLVAGDVHLVQQALEPRSIRTEAMAATPALAPKAVREEALFAYHLYTVERPTTLRENQKKQVALLQADAVRCRKEFLLKGQDYYFSTQVSEIGRKIKAAVYVELNNDKESGLGQPIPGGIFRVYKKDNAGFLQFVGEDRVEHTPEKELIRLHLGEAFDITADKHQMDFKKLKGTTSSNSVYESEYLIRIKNAQQEAVTVKVQEPIPGDWEMVSESLKHVKDSAHTASWLVTVPSKETVTLTYRVRMKQ